MRFLLESLRGETAQAQLSPEIWLYFSSAVDLFLPLVKMFGTRERLTVYKLHEGEQGEALIVKLLNPFTFFPFVLSFIPDDLDMVSYPLLFSLPL